MRRYVIASHHRLAKGLKDTLEFLTARRDIRDINAYVDDQDLDEQIQSVFSSFSPEDEVIIMTDMLGGSVNQHFCPYMSEKCHLICGTSLPCALSLVLIPDNLPLTREGLHQIVEDSKNHLIYVNEYEAANDPKDE